jgi:purine-nucleoside phosphorylase
MIDIVESLMFMIVAGSCNNQTKQIQLIDLTFLLQACTDSKVVEGLILLKNKNLLD